MANPYLFNSLYDYSKGKTLVPIQMLQNWVDILTIILPTTATQLNTQIQDCITKLNVTINTPNNPYLAGGNVVLIIGLVQELKQTNATIEFQELDPEGVTDANNFSRMVDNVNGVYNNYTLAYQVGLPQNKIAPYTQGY